MILVDSHCHLDCIDLSLHNENLDNVINNAKEAGVEYFLCVCITLNKFEEMLKTVQNYPNVAVTAGMHPNEEIDYSVTMNEILSYAAHPKVIGIGETGLDYYRSTGDLNWQRERFCNHIRAAKELQKPLVVHSRAAREDTITILKKERADQIGGVMHCFTEDWDTAQKALDLNFYISFSGILTFQNAKELRDVAKNVPLDRILVETDCPYLAPVPYRGKPNEPAYVRYVAEALSEIKQQPIEVIAEKTTANFFKLFKLAPLQVAEKPQWDFKKKEGKGS